MNSFPQQIEVKGAFLVMLLPASVFVLKLYKIMSVVDTLYLGWWHSFTNCPLVSASRILLLKKANTKWMAYGRTGWYGPSQRCCHWAERHPFTKLFMLISEGEACCCALLCMSISLNIVTGLFLPQKGDLFTLQNSLISLLLFTFIVIFFPV